MNIFASMWKLFTGFYFLLQIVVLAFLASCGSSTSALKHVGFFAQKPIKVKGTILWRFATAPNLKEGGFYAGYYVHLKDQDSLIVFRYDSTAKLISRNALSRPSIDHTSQNFEPIVLAGNLNMLSTTIDQRNKTVKTEMLKYNSSAFHQYPLSNFIFNEEYTSDTSSTNWITAAISSNGNFMAIGHEDSIINPKGTHIRIEVSKADGQLEWQDTLAIDTTSAQSYFTSLNDSGTTAIYTVGCRRDTTNKTSRHHQTRVYLVSKHKQSKIIISSPTGFGFVTKGCFLLQKNKMIIANLSTPSIAPSSLSDGSLGNHISIKILDTDSQRIVDSLKVDIQPEVLIKSFQGSSFNDYL